MSAEYDGWDGAPMTPKQLSEMGFEVGENGVITFETVPARDEEVAAEYEYFGRWMAVQGNDDVEQDGWTTIYPPRQRRAPATVRKVKKKVERVQDVLTKPTRKINLD